MRATRASALASPDSLGSLSIAAFNEMGFAGFCRDELRQLVHLPIGHFEHAPDVAHHPTCLQGAEGDDLRDTVGAIALTHVVDDFLAAVHAEINIEIGH